MKKIFFLLPFLSLVLTDSYAQFSMLDPRFSDDFIIPENYWEPKDTLANHVDFVCIFEYNVVDTVLHEARNYNLILQCSDTVATFSDFYDYKEDSLITAHHRKITVGEYRPIFNQAMRESSNYNYCLFYKRNFYRRNDSFIGRSFYYEESLPKWDWKLYEETRRVCGYVCHKAVAKHAGRIWTAWYTEEIPSNAGPWLFYGLPGLILAATDNTGTHSFEAISLQKPALPQLLWKKKTIKQTRSYSLKSEYNQAFHASSLFEAAGVVSDTKFEDKRRFYNPLELE